MPGTIKALDPVLAADGIAAIRFGSVSATSDGLNTVIPGVTGRRIRVLGYVLVVTLAGTIQIEDTGGAILASFPVAANGGVSYAGGIEAPAFQTDADRGLAIRNPAGVDTLGHITYVIF